MTLAQRSYRLAHGPCTMPARRSKRFADSTAKQLLRNDTDVAHEAWIVWRRRAVNLARAAATALLIALATRSVVAQPLGPDVTSWLINTSGQTGYHGIPSNVQLVRYSSDNVYVSCTCIPGYDIGPWAGNPNTPANQNFVFKITRTPQLNDGARIATPLGHIGVWTNGVSVFNAKDARSYSNANIWHQNAIVVEGPSFDTCLGHPAPNGEYHHHLNPRCLYDDRDSSEHSPIIGYAFDGFPIYGAYGYRNADGSGGITRVRSSYRLREEMNERNTLPDGTVLPQNQEGPAISVVYPLGYFVEDFAFDAAIGDLDEHNGRHCVTPEYPGGTYAYFVTLDERGNAAYPYTIGPTYRGTVPAGNTGPQSGHNTPTEPVTTYTGTSLVAEGESRARVEIAPNPAIDEVRIACASTRWSFSLRDMMGSEVARGSSLDGATTLDVSGVAPGAYLLTTTTSEGRTTSRLVVAR